MTFYDDDRTDTVLRRLRGVGRTVVAGIIDDEENAAKLAYQEFGTRDIPQRQTVAPAFDEGEERVVAGIGRGVERVIDGRDDGEGVAHKTGSALAAAIQRRIKSNTPPPLAASTLAARRARGNTSKRTLVDSGEMVGGVTFKVGEVLDDG